MQPLYVEVSLEPSIMTARLSASSPCQAQKIIALENWSSRQHRQPEPGRPLTFRKTKRAAKSAGRHAKEIQKERVRGESAPAARGSSNLLSITRCLLNRPRRIA